MKTPLTGVRHVFFDMDGTIYHGSVLFPTTIPFLNFLKERQIGYTFLSNNSSHGHSEYIKRLANFGIASEESNFYISTDYAIDYLKHYHPEIKRIHTLAMECMDRMFEDAGFIIDPDDPQMVIVGFDMQLNYENLCRTAWHLRRGIPGIATHPDVFCPTDKATWLVDCGAITACLEKATNTKIKVLGKPDPGMLHEAAGRIGIPVTETLMIGDRLATDIALGMNAGALTCHIVTPGADLIVPEGIVPDFAVANLGELQQIWSDMEQNK